MRKIICLFFISLCLWGVEISVPLSSQENQAQSPQDQSLLDAPKPPDDLPIQDMHYLIPSKIPKSASYLPLFQSMMHIQPGTFPNPIGVSLISSFTHERYHVKHFKGTLGQHIGEALCANLNIVPPEYKEIMQSICAEKDGAQSLNKLLGAGEEKEWALSDGRVETKTMAFGVKADVFLLPFMQLFATTAYIKTDQTTHVGVASMPTNGIGQIDFKMGDMSNSLDGWVAMGGANFLLGYKGFFASCMLSGGYVQLNDLKNHISGFVQKPLMYVAPRIGYSYHGILTAHVGLQRVILFGATKGRDLTQITGGIVSAYNVEVEKYPIAFLVGADFMPMRDFGISFEYVGSPDTNGLNTEIKYRF
ncbi:hypothetical protein [Helicobacter pametensis]|uniref:hypothetical protein n=1 Tax=Helicobacter pametensis TaxID=95149 RepID=UPI000480A546|nr:hypothetical protein [Helicobacter pametensis]